MPPLFLLPCLYILQLAIRLTCHTTEEVLLLLRTLPTIWCASRVAFSHSRCRDIDVQAIVRPAPGRVVGEGVGD